MDERAIIEGSAGARAALIAASYARLTSEVLAGDLWTTSTAVVAHGTEPSPRFFYANRQALSLFRMTAARFISMESRLSAGPADRADRAAMLAQLDATNVVRGYRGIRVASDGTCFTIENAVIWNLLDAHGQHHGQAAAFAQWEPLG